MKILISFQTMKSTLDKMKGFGYTDPPKHKGKSPSFPNFQGAVAENPKHKEKSPSFPNF